MSRKPSFAWTLLICAIAAWCGVGLFLSRIRASEADYVVAAAQEETSSGEAQSAALTHAAVVSSAAEAAQVQSALAADPVSFANLLQSVGSASGASVQISSALPEGVPAQSTASAAPSVYVFGFTVEATGSFASLMRALQLLETLPAPTSIEEVDLERAPQSGSAAASWQMNASIRLVTTDNISS